MKQELRQRLIWGAILLCAMVVIFVVGTPLVELALILAGCRLSYEWLHFKTYGSKKQNYIAAGLLATAVSVVFVVGCLGGTWWFLPTFAAFCVVLYIVTPGKYRNWNVMGFVYISLPLLAASWVLMHFERGALFLLWIIFIVALTDSCAYFFGRKLKGRKLVPSISPNKTWWGFVGGLLGGTTGALLGGFVCTACSFLMLALFGVCVALAAIGGDLVESYIKRLHNVKDAPPIIPGHGGLLDRTDAYLLAFPVAVGIIRLFPGQFPFVLLP